jgi:acyl-coenzyme A thioesterase PaaI-like protein
MWVHGGVSLAIADEAMAWAVIALRSRWAVTKEVTATFERPIEIDGAYRVEARVVGEEDKRVRAEATIMGEREQCHLSAWADMVVYSVVDAPDMLGTEVPDNVRKYLRENT